VAEVCAEVESEVVGAVVADVVGVVVGVSVLEGGVLVVELLVCLFASSSKLCAASAFD
jgi:sorbitol-specific phosphotransferase system component IIBC